MTNMTKTSDPTASRLIGPFCRLAALVLSAGLLVSTTLAKDWVTYEGQSGKLSGL